jgi:hypothetical protein
MPSYRIGTLIYLDKKTNPYTQQDDARKENVLFEISTDDWVESSIFLTGFRHRPFYLPKLLNLLIYQTPITKESLG